MLQSTKFVTAESIAKMPSGLSYEDASALPMVFLTVLYSLGEQAKIKVGGQILIHSAAGGVGSAAIQYAQYIGAEIFATASPSKHEYLQSIGISNISPSKNASVFEEEIMNAIWLYTGPA